MVNLTFIKVISSRTYVPFSFKTCGLWTEVSLCPPCTWPHANTLEDLLQSIKPFPLKLNPHLQKTDQAWGRIILANLPGGEWGLSLCGHLRALYVFKVLWDATSPGTHFSLDHFLCMFSLRGLTTVQQDSQIHRAKLDDVRPPLLADYKLFKRKLFENLLDCSCTPAFIIVSLKEADMFSLSKYEVCGEITEHAVHMLTAMLCLEAVWKWPKRWPWM